MKPISKTFDFSGGKTIKVLADGRYEWCGKLLGRDECVALDVSLLHPTNRNAFQANDWFDATLDHILDCPSIRWIELKPVTRFVRRYWEWIKGS